MPERPVSLVSVEAKVRLAMIDPSDALKASTKPEGQDERSPWRHSWPGYPGERYCDRVVRFHSGCSLDNPRPAAELGVGIRPFPSRIGKAPEEAFSKYDMFTTSRAFVDESVANSQPGPAGSLFFEG